MKNFGFALAMGNFFYRLAKHPTLFLGDDEYSVDWWMEETPVMNKVALLVTMSSLEREGKIERVKHSGITYMYPINNCSEEEIFWRIRKKDYDYSMQIIRAREREREENSSEEEE